MCNFVVLTPTNQNHSNMLKKIITTAALILIGHAAAFAQFNLSKAAKGIGKTVEAITLTDDQMSAYVKEYIDWMDQHNPILPDNDPYVQRLKKLTADLTFVEGTPLNFKVYNVVDVNAFACADESVRVFAALMDIMDDNELLGVIGHEIGHIALRHSKKAFKQALLTSALKDAVASTSNAATALTDTQLGALGEALASASYSKKQENQADEYGYEFLKSHGKNPLSMAKSFVKLKELQGSTQKTSKMNQLFSSHPDLDTRIKKMQERAKKDGYIE